jgi:hypothetical protein
MCAGFTELVTLTVGKGLHTEGGTGIAPGTAISIPGPAAGG